MMPWSCHIERFKNQFVYVITLFTIFFCTYHFAFAQLRGSIQPNSQSTAQNAQSGQGSSVLFTGTGVNSFYGGKFFIN